MLKPVTTVLLFCCTLTLHYCSYGAYVEHLFSPPASGGQKNVDLIGQGRLRCVYPMFILDDAWLPDIRHKIVIFGR